MNEINLKLLEEKLNLAKEFTSESLISKIKNFILNASKTELANINTNKLAEFLNEDKISLIKAFLNLTKLGVFNLLWVISCPTCKGSNQITSSLKEMKHDSNCELCKINYGAGFDKNITLSFEINANILKLENLDAREVIFSGLYLGEQNKFILKEDENILLKNNVIAENHLLINLTEKKVINIASINPLDNDILYINYNENIDIINIVKVKKDNFVINLTNKTNKEQEFIFTNLKNQEWSDAAFITSLQEFRDLFSDEVLDIDEAFSIQNLAFIFTDIKGSTELYEKIGDSKAFFLIKEHFKILESIVKKNNGCIVKTIGDAIMAVFSVNKNALISAYEMIDAFDSFNDKNHTTNQIFIKIGIHNGSCIAVNLNDRLDYFGTSVNTAARVQGLSDGREIMLSENFFKDSFASDFFKDKNWEINTFTTSLKGLKDNYNIFRLLKN